MSNQADDPNGLRDRLRKADAAIGEVIESVRRDPNRRLGYRVADETTEMLQARTSEVSVLKGEVLEAAAQEEGRDLAGLAELASTDAKTVSRQRVHNLISQARAARPADQREETA